MVTHKAHNCLAEDGIAFTFDFVLIVGLAAALLIRPLNFLPDDWSVYPVIIFSLIGLVPVVASGLKAIVSRHPTIDLLASIALITALLAGEWVSAAFITLMIASARGLDRLTTWRTKQIIAQLLKYYPETVKVKEGERVVERHINALKVKDLVIVEAGERVAVDGTVVSGQASLDQSTLTGESEPQLKRKGMKVFSSTLCASGSLLVRAERVGADTTLAKLVALIDEASRAKASVERLADRFAMIYVLLTLGGAILVYLWSGNLGLVLAILLVVCADDLAVSVPLSYTAGIARAARRGVIVKGGGALEALSQVRAILTDKTGTLTLGRPKVLDVLVMSGITKEKFLRLLSLAETNSRHPVSFAINQFIKDCGLPNHSPDKFIEHPGEGMEVEENGQRIWSGKVGWLKRLGVPIDAATEKLLTEKEGNGQSIVALAVDGRLAGLVFLADTIRPATRSAIRETLSLGIKTWVMLTGDNREVAARVAGDLGIGEYYAELKPKEKLQLVKKMRRRYGHIAMVGDGVNDAPALALADVSIAMADIGAAVSIETADIAIVRGQVKRLPETIALSRRVLSVVRLNFWLWGLTNAFGLGLVFGGIIGPVGASIFNFITDFLPIANSLRIFIPANHKSS